jgi:hypothetical protein
MSHHFICELGASLAGPRYDDIKNIAFEVQVRTILMDAWANISHYLAYKGEASVPDDLQRDFHALSGLFYVADRHFELFYHESQESKSRAKLAITEPGSQDTRLDRDTTLALFQELYPDRKHARPEYVSEFVEEILPFDYRRLVIYVLSLSLFMKPYCGSNCQNISRISLRTWELLAMHWLSVIRSTVGKSIKAMDSAMPIFDSKFMSLCQSEMTNSGSAYYA